MPIQIDSAGWRIRPAGRSRGALRDGTPDLPAFPQRFLTADSRVVEEVILEPRPAVRRAERAAEGLDLSYVAGPGQTAVLAIRHPSGALTFHPPVQTTSRGARGSAQIRFRVALRQPATRGVVDQAIKAIVIRIAKTASDRAASVVLPRLAERVEKALWKQRGLEEGWLKVTKDTLAARALERARPVSSDRSLLFIHGTFSDTVSAYHALADSDFFDRVQATYADRIFAFDHFTVSRTPEQNARMLLEGLPDHATTFDVVTHSRGGLVLRTLVERTKELGPLARRFRLGRAVLVASPNEGTPLATPKRWDETFGWLANLLEMLPDNPFTSGAAFVANALVWLATHASGDLPGLRSMDRDGELVAAIQGPPGPPADAYSALVANHHPTADTLRRLQDVGIDQFFASANDLVVPSEGGWRIDRAHTTFIPASRIGCFGPGGNLPPDSVSHVSFFSHRETADFLVNALLGRPQPLDGVDPHKTLPDHRLSRGGMTDAVASSHTPRAGTRTRRAKPAKLLRITVRNGDLTFEPEVLLLGHYRSSRLTGTEEVVDRLIGGAMARSLQRGLYPSSVGSHQVFINTRSDAERGSFIPRPKAVIVVGLGDEGKLQAADLVRSVRQGVLGWAQRLSEGSKHPPASFLLASTILGSGGTGVGAGAAARLIVNGVTEANALLGNEAERPGRWPRVSHLRLIELYLDRATEGWHALQMQAEATPGQFEIDDAVEKGNGSLRQPPNRGYRGANYDFIAVQTTKDADGLELISFTLDTKRARSEVRGQRTQSRLLRELVTTAADDRNRDRQIGKTLFDLLVPPEIEPYLVGSGEMQMQLDAGTARIPWELLDTGPGGGSAELPWALRVKLLRKLQTDVFREQVVDADADASVLVIGEPACSDGYARLYGARREAIAVRDCLVGPDGLDRALVSALVSDDPLMAGADALTVVNAVFERPWRIVHITGHGSESAKGKPGGVVLSDGSVLGPDEFANMRTVPELVFVNCCHLAGGDPDQLLKPPRHDRAGFAASVAEALIRIGVRCVIAAGWAVDDDAASVFAESFYRSLLQGNRFIDAVAQARRKAYESSPDVNTWAAYQCYGDPDWTFQRKAADANQYAGGPPDYSHVASATMLLLELERIVVESRFQGAEPAKQLEKLGTLATRFAERWGSNGAVAELFAEAFVEAREIEQGMAWYERAVAAADGRASLKAAEQLANVRCRFAWELVEAAGRKRQELRQRTAAGQASTKAEVAGRRAAKQAEQAFRYAITRADDLLEGAAGLLATLNTLKRTMERASLAGSVHMRRALVDMAAGRGSVPNALRQMLSSYREAQIIGAQRGATDLYYPASNCLAADVALNGGTRGWRGPDSETVEIIGRSLSAHGGGNADFWSVVGGIVLRQYQALARRRLSPSLKALRKDYQDLHARAGAPWMWSSVYDTACLVLSSYARRAPGREQAAAHELLTLIRLFAHPGPHG